MSKLSYLQDPKWLRQREAKWEKYVARWYFDSSEKEIEFRKAYFFRGDITPLLSDEYETSLYDVISNAPFNETSLVVKNIVTFWFWVMRSPGSRDRFEQNPNLNERFLAHFSTTLSRKDDNLHPDVCVGLFFWLYGESFNMNRVVTLVKNEKEVIIPVIFNIDDLCQRLLSGIIKYLWRKDEGENICIFKALIPYFLSLYPHMSPSCFSKTLPCKRQFLGDDKKTYQRSWYIWNRWLLTALNGYITEFEQEVGINELVCNDESALVQLKEGLDALNMPQTFYQLQDFVLKHKGDSLYTTYE